MTAKYSFASDYLEGAHPAILRRLVETNLLQTSGYGTDEFSDAARAKIKAACGLSEAEIYFLIGGTQANAVVIDTMLYPYEGVVAASSGHVAQHEAGAIEYGGHKVLSLPQKDGKITAAQIEDFVTKFYQDANHEHMVFPGLVYLSQPTEYGTLYSLEELTAIHETCAAHHLPLYVDGARLAYALAAEENDVSLKDLAGLADVFYIGGTKCGALFGEAVVFPQSGTVPHFLTQVKQHGALLAKGRIAGLQFDTLFTDGLYENIGRPAITAANQIRAALKAKGYSLYMENPTNQIFVLLTHAQREKLEQSVELGYWEAYDETRDILRIATSWATSEEQVEALLALL